MDIKFREELPPIDSYMKLVESTGWEGILSKGADKLSQANSNSWYSISAFNQEELIGFGRILSDGGLHALICDLIVLPKYQGKEIGSSILKRLLLKCKEHEILMVQLFAAKDKFEFYKKFGFEERPMDAPGMRWIHREIV